MTASAVNYRLRIELADRPGVFAGATAALAAMGVNVLAIDVLEENGPTVVDELVVSLPPGVPVEDVEDALTVAGAIEVLSTTAGGPLEDPIVRTLNQIRRAMSAPRSSPATGESLAAMAYADEGQLVHLDEAMPFPLAMRALSTRVPATGRAGSDTSPLGLTSGWVLWVAPDGPDPQYLAVVGRRLNVRFSAAEAARLRAVASLLSTAGVLTVG